MDLSKLVTADEARPLEILTPDGKPVGLTMHIMALDSRAARDASKKHADAFLKSKTKELDTDITMAEGLDKLAACVTGWDWHGNSWNGVKNPELTVDLVKDVLGQLWIARQVDAFASDLANFTKPAAKD